MLCKEIRPPLWSSGQSFWLQIQRSRVDSRRYQIFWEVVGLERDPLSLMSTTEVLLGRKYSGSGIETEKTAGGMHRADHAALFPQMLALTSPTNGGRYSTLADWGHGVFFSLKTSGWISLIMCCGWLSPHCSDVLLGAVVSLSLWIIIKLHTIKTNWGVKMWHHHY
jgi:hypothetical protein